jgi:DNA-binding response OmpR family regulator
MMDKLKILIAEDDKTTQRLYDSFLVDDVFEKNYAKSGQEALELYSSWQPDIILLDLMLPTLSGYSLLRILREEKQDKLTPIIISSSLSSKEDVMGCAKLGIQGYLAKPVQWKEIGFKILEFYGKGSPEKAGRTTELKKKLEEGVEARRSKALEERPPDQKS